MAELRNCPFCGGEARINSDPEAVRDTEGHLWAFTVGCSKCCATSGLCCSPDKAIEAWNTRKPEEAVVAELENLKGEYEHHCIHGAWQRGAIQGAKTALSKAISIVRGRR